MKTDKKTHWSPVEDKAEKTVKPKKEEVKEKPIENDPAKWHGWADPGQCLDMIDEMIKFLTDGGHPCPFKREGA